MNDVLNIDTARHCFVRSTIRLGLIAVTLSTVAAAAGQPSAPDSREPSAIELALAEYVCGPKTAATSDAGYLDCLSARVAAMRADFGYDLTRLSATRRKAIDKSCGRRLTAEGHDAYVACVTSELASLQDRRTAPGSPTTPQAAGEQAATAGALSPRSSSSAAAVWLFGFLGVVVVAAGIPFAMRIRTAQHTCRNCGTTVPPTADLCPACRKQAAEAVRHAAAERIERARAFEEGGRRLEVLTQPLRAADEVPVPVQIAPEETVHQPREEEPARVTEEPPPQADVAHRGEGDQAAMDGELFDPYAVLGVSPDAGPEGIDAAYQQARSKYDPAAVDFLGEELQQYYKSKADAVDRAYRMLAGDVPSSPSAAS